MYVCMYVLAVFTKLFSATKSVSLSKYRVRFKPVPVAVVLFCFKFKQLRQVETPLPYMHKFLNSTVFFFVFF